MSSIWSEKELYNTKQYNTYSELVSSAGSIRSSKCSRSSSESQSSSEEKNLPRCPESSEGTLCRISVLPSSKRDELSVNLMKKLRVVMALIGGVPRVRCIDRLFTMWKALRAWRPQLITDNEGRTKKLYLSLVSNGLHKLEIFIFLVNYFI